IETLDILQVVPGHPAHGVGRDEAGDDDAHRPDHARPASSRNRRRTGSAPNASAATRRAPALCAAESPWMRASASTASSIVENANSPDPVSTNLPKPVSCV